MPGAWLGLEERLRLPTAEATRHFPQNRWHGEPGIEGRRILLHAEAGLGNTIQFVRYAPLVATLGATVLLAVQPELKPLLTGMPGVESVHGPLGAWPEFDLHCPLMSLPMAFATTEQTIPRQVPYLAVDPDAIASWQTILPAPAGAQGLRIGLVWAGASRPQQPHAAAIDRRRSMALAQMAPLGGVPGNVFVSLQLGPAAAQIETAPFPLLDVAARLTDFAETAALVEALDLIIAVDTAVAHLAGALGKPVWLLSRHDACWRWGRDRDDSPWYPTMRLFRQTTPGDWAGVMERVAASLPGFQVFG
jgi:hypothetical protein